MLLITQPEPKWENENNIINALTWRIPFKKRRVESKVQLCTFQQWILYDYVVVLLLFSHLTVKMARQWTDELIMTWSLTTNSYPGLLQGNEQQCSWREQTQLSVIRLILSWKCTFFQQHVIFVTVTHVNLDTTTFMIFMTFTKASKCMSHLSVMNSEVYHVMLSLFN